MRSEETPTNKTHPSKVTLAEIKKKETKKAKTD